MSKPAKRSLLGRGRGYLNAAGTQARFIVFLLSVLIVFGIILRVFQKLAVIVQLPVFLPVSFLVLLALVGVAGAVYSHSFIGPMARIRKAVEQLAQGNTAISLHLRDSDDPMLKDLVSAINTLREHSKSTAALVKEASGDLLAEISDLQIKIDRGADKPEMRKQMEIVKIKHAALDKILHANSIM